MKSTKTDIFIKETENKTFSNLNIDPLIVSALKQMSIIRPSTIQYLTIPIGV